MKASFPPCVNATPPIGWRSRFKGCRPAARTQCFGDRSGRLWAACFVTGIDHHEVGAFRRPCVRIPQAIVAERHHESCRGAGSSRELMRRTCPTRLLACCRDERAPRAIGTLAHALSETKADLTWLLLWFVQVGERRVRFACIDALAEVGDERRHLVQVSLFRGKDDDSVLVENL